MSFIENINIIGEELLPTPSEIKEQVPLTASAAETVVESRKALLNILDRRDPRRFIVVGPCSIHHQECALEYAARLAELSKKVSDTFLLVMRTYFEKPRTAVGWKGLINDPDLNDSFNISKGLATARTILRSINELGLGTGTEALDPVTPQYLDDLISWSAIGARTTESQTHRELASGLSTPVGFKNGTDGNIRVAINAMRSSSQPHCFLGVNSKGQCTIMKTRGNRYGHVVLRGGAKPNYDKVSIANCERELEKSKLPVNIVVDCSHGNSLKDASRQPLVFEDCISQIAEGNKSIVGLMLESNLQAGRQDIPTDLASLKYGVSVTDECIDWETTERLILVARAKINN